jgi:hypothetical protein
LKKKIRCLSEITPPETRITNTEIPTSVKLKMLKGSYNMGSQTLVTPIRSCKAVSKKKKGC